MSAFGRCARRCAAASPPPCSLSWTSTTTVTSARVWTSVASSANIPPATSASRPQSAWTSLWKSHKCFTTKKNNTQTRTNGNHLFVKIFPKPTCRDTT